MQYTYLEKLLDHGLFVVVKSIKNNDFKIISPFVDGSNRQECSNWEDLIEDCKKGLFNDFCNQQDLEIRCKYWTLVECYYQPFKPFEVGQRVKVMNGNFEAVIEANDVGIKGCYFLKDLENEYHHTELLPLPDETPITLSNEELLQEVKRWGLTTTGEIIKS